MGNCIRKQRERELAKRALRREELVSYFLDKEDDSERRQKPLAPQVGIAKPPKIGVGGGGGDGGSIDNSLSRAAAKSARDSPGNTSLDFGAAIVATAAAAAAASAAGASADEASGGWHLTDRQREAALYAIENDGIERLHDNAELQLEQRRERMRREERLDGLGVSGGGGGGGGVGSGGCGGGASSTPVTSYHGNHSLTATPTRHVSFGGAATVGYRR